MNHVLERGKRNSHAPVALRPTFQPPSIHPSIQPAFFFTRFHRDKIRFPGTAFRDKFQRRQRSPQHPNTLESVSMKTTFIHSFISSYLVSVFIIRRNGNLRNNIIAIFNTIFEFDSEFESFKETCLTILTTLFTISNPAIFAFVRSGESIRSTGKSLKKRKKKNSTNWRDALTNVPAQCENNETQPDHIACTNGMEEKRIIVSLFLPPSESIIRGMDVARATTRDVHCFSINNAKESFFSFYPRWIFIDAKSHFSLRLLHHRTKNIVRERGKNFRLGFAGIPSGFPPDYIPDKRAPSRPSGGSGPIMLESFATATQLSPGFSFGPVSLRKHS